MRALDAFAFVSWPVLFAMLYIANTHRLAFDIVVRERGPVELGTFAAYFVACVLFARLSIGAARRRERWPVTAWYAFFAVLCFLAAGEEISWGQALFHYATPFGLADVNEQGELNFHNLPGVMELNSVFLPAFGISGLAGIWLARFRAFRGIAIPRALGPLMAWIAALGLLATACDLWLLLPVFDQIVLEMSELTELFVALACVAYALLAGHALQETWRATSAVTGRADAISG